jgi:hypothetical protein
MQNQNDTPKPDTAEQPADEWLDATACSPSSDCPERIEETWRADAGWKRADEAEAKLEAAYNAIRFASERFERVDWGWDGDCGSKDIIATLEDILPENNTNEERERIANDALFGGWREVPKAEWDAWVESRGADTLVNNCSEPPTLQARLHGEVIAIAKLYDGSNYHGGKSPKYLLPNASRLASADPETPNP